MRNFLSQGWILSAVVTASFLVLGCGPNPYEAYIAAMRAQGQAERGVCRMSFDESKRTHTINSGQIARCIRDMNDVRDLYEKAKKVGYEGKDLELSLQKVDNDLRKLKSMQAMVSEMELE